jgi:hypothetical protein
MKLCLLACNVFLREACHCLARSPHVIDPLFFELGEHARPDALRTLLQEKIDACSAAPRGYDAICLLYGLCGNATNGLVARSIPLVLPRAHDCCTVLLGSRQRFRELFGDNPSTPFSSAGYAERGEYYLRLDDGVPQVHSGDAYADLVARYGEENARYVWDTMHPARAASSNTMVFINLDETAHLGFAARVREEAEREQKQFTELPGDLRLIRALLDGAWAPDEFLVVLPGQAVAAVYDWDVIVRAVEVGQAGAAVT